MFFLRVKYAAVLAKKGIELPLGFFFYIKSISYKVIKEKDK